MESLHPALPPRVSLPWVVAAVVTWVAAFGYVALTPPAPLEPGRVSGEGVLLADPVASRFGYQMVIETEDGNVLLDLDEPGGLLRGSRVRFRGTAKGAPGRIGTHRYRGRVSVDRLEVDAEVPFIAGLGATVRERVIHRLEPGEGGRALLAGFLIGDTSGLTLAEEEAMRRAGLSHFVAVSGSNVALFVGLLVFAAGPLALGPRRRALVGLIGLPVYAAATRFEPSVIRASVMAALALVGRLVGVVFEAWQLLSLAVVVLLVLQPALVLSAGFQLSVAATAGVLVGARWPISGGRVGRALAVTLGAQTAVAPLLLGHFGTVPLMSPLMNLLAAPLVAASTLIGAVGVVGPDFLVDAASALAGVVLFLARGADAWPQLGLVGTLVLGTAGLLAIWRPRIRPALALAGLLSLIVILLGFGAGLPPDGSVVVLDVGQGDAILIHGGADRFALVDGGPDESVLVDRLRDHGVERIELVVLSHVHADHASGLVGLPSRFEIGRVWARTAPHETDASTRLMATLSAAGVPVAEPGVGATWQLGDLALVVEAPLRRYASPNDQSIVIKVVGPSRTMLLAGDVEVVAQRELGHLRADVLKVPHQGAATSDPEWLVGVGAELAIISVGPNQFGHPAQWVIDLFHTSSTQVLRTDEVGDITVPLAETHS